MFPMQEIEYVLINYHDMKTRVLLVFVLLTVVATCAHASPELSYGGWTVNSKDQLGDIYYRSVLIATPGMLQLFAPAYKSGYFSTSTDGVQPLQLISKVDGLHFARQISTKLLYGSLQSRETCDLASNGLARFTLKLVWNGDRDTVLEWNPVLLNISPFIGSVVTTGSGQPTVIPYILHGHPGMLTMASDFHSIEFRHTAVGDIHLSSAGISPSLGDGRNDPYLSNQQVLWPGLLGITVHPGQVVNTTILVHIVGDTTSIENNSGRTMVASTTLLKDALGPPPIFKRILIPAPKSVVWRKTAAIHCNMPSVRVSPNVSAMIARGDLANLQPVIKILGVSNHRVKLIPHTRNVVQLVFGATRATLTVPAPPRHEEGYAILARRGYISAVGSDDAGIRWALASVLQLLHRTAPGLFVLQRCNIRDWPSMRFRGIHLFVGKNALPFHDRLLKRVLAPLKINRLVLECEYAAWKGHPDLVTPFAMSLKDLHKEVINAKRLGVEPIPLIETLGHSQWLFYNKRNLKLSEDPTKPFAYDATNPDVYKVVFDIFRQALRVFGRPREFHIGHDEVKIPGFTGFGEYPARPKNVKIGLVLLFVGDVLSLHNWLARHGAKTMMWGDMLLNRSEGTKTAGNPTMQAANAPSVNAAEAMRNALPKDITICDWRYGTGSEQRNGLSVFQKAGFTAIGSSWYEPGNIEGWAKQIIKHKSRGLLQTTWDGYNSNAGLLNTSFRQYSAFVDAADAAWSGHILPRGGCQPSQFATPTASYVFRQLYEPRLSAYCAKTGWAADLTDRANIAVDSALPVPWSQIKKPATSSRLVRLQRGIGINYNGTAIMFASNYSHGIVPNAPRSLTITVNRRVRVIAFLHAVTYPVPKGTLVANIIVHYANGKAVDVPVHYGDDIDALSSNQTSQSILSERIPCIGHGHGLMMRSFTWHNQVPEQVVENITYRSVSSQTSALLFGVTGLTSK